MLRNSHLFTCHKFLEKTGGQILTNLAKFDFRNLHGLAEICEQIEKYIATLKNHALWEEEFIFKKFFTQDEVSSFFKKHADLEHQAEKIIAELKGFPETDLQSRIHKGKAFYLNFRLFYSTNLIHFYEEETSFLSLLEARTTEAEIRAIDKSIYESMSSADMVEMLRLLLPPANSYEKKNILEDLKYFNPHNFDAAFSVLGNLLSKEEHGYPERSEGAC